MQLHKQYTSAILNNIPTFVTTCTQPPLTRELGACQSELENLVVTPHVCARVFVVMSGCWQIAIAPCSRLSERECHVRGEGGLRGQPCHHGRVVVYMCERVCVCSKTDD